MENRFLYGGYNHEYRFAHYEHNRHNLRDGLFWRFSSDIFVDRE
jgi:hypothetical protein